MGAWSSDSEGESNRELFYLSTEPGAAAREGWYDLDVQTSKRPFASGPESGQWKEMEEWTSVRVVPSDNAEGEDGGNKKKGGSKKKKVNREFGKRVKGHKSQVDQSKSRSEAQPGGGDGSGEATVATSSEGRNNSTDKGKHNGGGGGVNNNDGKPAPVSTTSSPQNSRSGAKAADTNGAQPLSSSKNGGSRTVGSDGGAGGREGNSSDGYLAAAVAMPGATEKGRSSSDSPNSRPEKRRRQG